VKSAGAATATELGPGVISIRIMPEKPMTYVLFQPEGLKDHESLWWCKWFFLPTESYHRLNHLAVAERWEPFQYGLHVVTPDRSSPFETLINRPAPLIGPDRDRFNGVYDVKMLESTPYSQNGVSYHTEDLQCVFKNFRSRTYSKVSHEFS
jgi:hypothetical protein